MVINNTILNKIVCLSDSSENPPSRLCWVKIEAHWRSFPERSGSALNKLQAPAEPCPDIKKLTDNQLEELIYLTNVRFAIGMKLSVRGYSF